jgi:hypothetical protein
MYVLNILLKRSFLYKGERKMEFDKNKGFCNGLYIHDGGCEVTFHSLKHTQSEITLKSCKKCTCPLARNHKKEYSAEKRKVIV